MKNSAPSTENNNFKYTSEVKSNKSSNLISSSQITSSGRVSKRINDNNSQNDEMNVDIVESDDENEDDIPSSQKTNKRDARTSSKIRLNKDVLLDLTKDMHSSIDIFFRSDELLLECFLEALTTILFLGVIRTYHSDVIEFATNAIVDIGAASEIGMMAIYRAIMPALTMSGSRIDLRIPDNSKAFTASHKIAVKTINILVSKSEIITKSWHNNENDNDEYSSSENRCHSLTPKSPFQSKKCADLFDLPFTCAIGALQRMTVSVPDRASTRSSVMNSIVDILTTIGSIKSDDEIKNNLNSRKSINHYLLFLAKLSRSSKVGHRAYCLDISTAVMSKAWFWTFAAESEIIHSNTSISSPIGDDNDGDFMSVLKSPATKTPLPSKLTTPGSTSSNIDVSSSNVGPRALLGLVVSRCDDSTPTVRVRAISSICDLLDRLSEDTDATLCEYLLQLALGVDLDSFGSSTKGTPANLLEILRTRTQDDKPLVRSKAIQAYGIALGKQWPKFVTSPALDVEVIDGNYQFETTIEFVTMHISEDDVNVFMEGCNDVSLSVRKQSLSSITFLVKTRSSELIIQDAWVVSALPLASDAETTVQIKLASCAYNLLIEPAIEWEKTYKTLVKQHKSQRGEFDLIIPSSISWILCMRIALSGRLKLLKSTVKIMIQQGFLGEKGSSISSLISAVKTACCYSLTSDESNNSKNNIVEISNGAWVLLESIMGQEAQAGAAHIVVAALANDNGSADFVVKSFQEKRVNMKAKGIATNILDDEDVRMLRVLDKLTNFISKENSEYISKELFSVLMSMQSSAASTSIAISVKYNISKSLSQKSSLNNDIDINSKSYLDVQSWSGSLLSLSYSIIYNCVKNSPLLPNQGFFDAVPSVLPSSIKKVISQPIDFVTFSTNNDSVDLAEMKRNLVINALFSLGEIAMLGFASEEDETVTSRIKTSIENKGLPKFTVSTTSKTFKLLIPEQLIKIVQLLMGSTLPNEDKSEAIERLSPNVVRAHSIVTMGKFCLRDKILARELINIFLRELQVNNNLAVDSNGAASVRSNSLLVLGDLCVRYTSLVDRHIGAMASCLQDSCVMVRRHALVLLTQLLLQDFLKWRGMLLFRFLATPVDSDLEMANFARTLLKSTLHTKYPDIFAHHFSEALIVFNGYTDHPAYVAAALSGSDGGSCAVTMEGVDMEGANRRSRRLKLYAMMMEDFTEEQKIAVTAKLVQDILAHAVDVIHARRSNADTSKNKAFEDVLEDALLVLQSPLLKIGRNKNDDIGDSEEMDAAVESTSVAVAKAKTKVLVKISRQHLVSHVLPVVMSLKSALESVRSPLQGAVMEYLISVVKSNKVEVNQVLQSDPTLKSEIEYDMKIFEKAKEEKENSRRIIEEDATLWGAVDYNNVINNRVSLGRVSLEVSSDHNKSSNSASLTSISSPQLKSALRQGASTGRKSSSRTPKDSLKCITGSNVRPTDDLADRLLGFDDYNNENDRGVTFSGNITDNNESNSNSSKRRSWSVCVQGLEKLDGENIDTNADNSDDEVEDGLVHDDIFSPLKKKGGKKKTKKFSDKDSLLTI
jgi:hypothetical protein